MSGFEEYGQIVELDGKRWRLIEMLKPNMEGNFLCLAVEADSSYPKVVSAVVVPGDKL